MASDDERASWQTILDTIKRLLLVFDLSVLGTPLVAGLAVCWIFEAMGHVVTLTVIGLGFIVLPLVGTLLGSFENLRSATSEQDVDGLQSNAQPPA